MQVLHIIRATGLAGAENHLLTLLSGLRAQGIDARLMLWVAPDIPADEIVAAAEKHDIPIERWIMPGLFAPRFFLKFVRYLRHNRPNIVHTHLVHAETYAIPAAKLAGVRGIVNSCHNDDPFRRHPIMRWRSWLLWRMANRGIAISNAIKKFLIDVEYAPAEKVETIYYGLTPPPAIPPEQFKLRRELGLAPDTRLIGSICRLIDQKGIAYALDALAEILPRYPNLHYIVAGEGNLKADLIAQAQNLGIAERVHFIGWRTDAPALMAQFEIFLAPSLWEGFGLVFLEAMAQSRPIISTRVTSIPEVVADEVCGLLVPPQDSQAIKEAVSRLLDDRDYAEKMGQAGREQLENVFHPRFMVEKTAAVYKAVSGQQSAIS